MTTTSSENKETIVKQLQDHLNELREKIEHQRHEIANLYSELLDVKEGREQSDFENRTANKIENAIFYDVMFAVNMNSHTDRIAIFKDFNYSKVVYSYTHMSVPNRENVIERLKQRFEKYNREQVQADKSLSTIQLEYSFKTDSFPASDLNGFALSVKMVNKSVPQTVAQPNATPSRSAFTPTWTVTAVSGLGSGKTIISANVDWQDVQSLSYALSQPEFEGWTIEEYRETLRNMRERMDRLISDAQGVLRRQG